jgi:hypothetical protein
LVIPGLSGYATHNASGGMAVESLTGAVHEDRALETLTDREVEYPGDPLGHAVTPSFGRVVRCAPAWHGTPNRARLLATGLTSHRRVRAFHLL